MKVLLYWATTILSVSIAIVMSGTNFSSFVQPSAILIVMGPALTFTVITFGLKGVIPFLGRLFLQKLTPEDAKFITSLCFLSLFAGITGAIIGGIHIFENFADPSNLGSSAALMLNSLWLGISPMVLLKPLAN